MRVGRGVVAIALSNPHFIGVIVECDERGNVTERKSIICDGRLVAEKVKKSWKEAW